MTEITEGEGAPQILVPALDNGKQGHMIHEWVLVGQAVWRDTWVCLQEPEAILILFRIPARKALTPPGNQEADAPAQTRALATDPLVDTADLGV